MDRDKAKGCVLMKAVTKSHYWLESVVQACRHSRVGGFGIDRDKIKRLVTSIPTRVNPIKIIVL